MIDKICLRCDFARVFDLKKVSVFPTFNLRELNVPLEMSLDADGIETNLRHPWESIPSSFTGLAFKVFDYRYTALKEPDFYIEIKASPAKLMYGHNIYGSSNFKECAFFMIELLENTYPKLFGLLDMRSWYLSDFDVTYFSRAECNTLATQFINALQNVSRGQTKSRKGHDGTAYFGSIKSRLKKIKVYGKHNEVLKEIEENKLKKSGAAGKKRNEVYTPELIEWTQGMIRWEATLFHRWLERRGISCYLIDLIDDNSLSPEKLIKLWREAHNDLFASLEGLDMTTVTDQNVQKLLRDKFFKVSEKTGKTSYAVADAAFRTYRIIQIDGWDVAKASMSKPTFYRHVSNLVECGISRALLQNLKGNGQANVIPFYRFICVEFGEQVPPWVTEQTDGSLILHKTG
jgi:II/X family phage/plasmid replication protein